MGLQRILWSSRYRLTHTPPGSKEFLRQTLTGLGLRAFGKLLLGYDARRFSEPTLIRALQHGYPQFSIRIGPSLGLTFCLWSSCQVQPQLRRRGKARNRRPLAANTALAMAGATGGTPGSPAPPGGASVGTIYTSTRGISANVRIG